MSRPLEISEAQEERPGQAVRSLRGSDGLLVPPSPGRPLPVLIAIYPVISAVRPLTSRNESDVPRSGDTVDAGCFSERASLYLKHWDIPVSLGVGNPRRENLAIKNGGQNR